MLTLRMGTWPLDTGLDHVSSSWQVSLDIDFNTIMDESLEDTSFKDIYYSNVVVPVGQVYYGRSKRHFSNGTETDWIGPVKLFAAEASEHIDIKPEVTVEKPTAILNKDDIIDEDKNIIILKSGSFRCSGDGHYATHWILRDGLGKVLFHKLYDTENKDSLAIIKDDIDLSNTNTVILEVSHVSTNMYESSFGKCKIKLNKFNLEITSKLIDLSPLEDFNFSFNYTTDPDCVEDITTIQRIEIKDTDDNIIFNEIIDSNITSIIVPREIIKQRTTYFINLYHKHFENEIKTVTFNTVPYRDTYKINKDYNYEEVYIDTGFSINRSKIISSEQFLDNGIPVYTDPDNDDILPVDTELLHYNKRNNTLTISDLASDFLKKVTDGTSVSFKVLDSRRILIDRLDNTTGKPEFSIYDYQYQTLLNTVIRNDEVVKTGEINNLTTGPDNKLYYFALVGTEVKLRVLDIDTYVITTLSSRPDIDNLDATLDYIEDGRLVSFNGSLNKDLCYTYDLGEDIWHDVTLVPERFRDLSVSTFKRKDGKIIGFNNGSDTNDFLLFNPENNSFSEITNGLDDDINLDSTIRLRNGEFLRYQSDTVDSKVYLYK